MLLVLMVFTSVSSAILSGSSSSQPPIITSSGLVSSSTEPPPIQPPSGTVAGLNYLSSGNRWDETNSQLNTDFSRFASDGIKHISVRLMWSVMEPSYYADYSHLSSTGLSNVKRVLQVAEDNGIKVNIDFWTQHGYTLGLPSWVQSYWDIEGDSTVRDRYVRYMTAVVNSIKNYSAIESYTVMNEPWWGTASNGVYADKAEFQATFPILYNAIKSEDPSRLVTCRFTLSYTPGSGQFDASVYDVFDVFALTEYLDPDNPSDTRYNGRWSYWDKTISDLTARGKDLWVIEFGCSSDWATESEIATRYSQSLQKFNATGIVKKAYSWAWQTRSGSAELFNIYDGSYPRPAYDELTLFPDTS
jgi:endo-1,4-beta-mannosidase